MVSVRKSHHLTSPSFEHWLAQFSLPEPKQQALTHSYSLLDQQLELNHSHVQPILGKAMEMVEILAGLNMDASSLSAALCIPFIEAEQLSLETIEQKFKPDIYQLCCGVQQMESIKALSQSKSSQSQNIDNIRKMLLAMVEDVRAVVIKLAERVCHLRLIKNQDEETKVLAAKETSLIYAPLANRLGIGQLKWELEDISFRYLHPETYKKIAKMLDEKRVDREQYMENFVALLQQKLADMQLKAQVYGRPKHIYSIWKKMQNKSLDFAQLFDVRAVRIVVEKLQDCYTALGVVHTNWKHLAKEFDDYIATPKPNGYQSIHTVVLGPEGKAVEVQIRTEQMHQDAELGVAAHWRYKEGSAHGKTSGFDDKVSWLRKILQWQADVSENTELLDELRSQVFDDRIYVFTPNGDVIDLPKGSTPLDFAYYIHSNIGHRCVGAKVSGRIVPFTYQLQTGDQIEILTSKTPNPSRDWLNPNLNYLHSARARAKVQHFFKQQDKDKHLTQGKALLDDELNKHKLDKVDYKLVAQRFNVNTPEDLYIAIGAGNARLQQVVNFIVQQFGQHDETDDLAIEDVVKPQPETIKKRIDKNGIIVSGVGNLLTHIAQCCQPVPGDNILGFITQGRGVSVHRADCEQLAHLLELQPEREIEIQWGVTSQAKYQAKIQIHCADRQGLVRDISTIVANDKLSIFGMESRSDPKEQTVTMILTLEVSDQQTIQKLLSKLSQIDDVLEVKRL